jgi:hypothetical protein
MAGAAVARAHRIGLARAVRFAGLVPLLRRCHRARTCAGDDPEACRQRLWFGNKAKSKALRREWTRLEGLKSL